MIYDEVWGHHNGANGLGVIGENNGNYEYDWLYALDNHTGEFNFVTYLPVQMAFLLIIIFLVKK